jgi:hypothetical protein
MILLCVIALAPVVLAQPEATPIPVKEYLNTVGAIDIIIRVYDAPQGGTLLYQVTQSVTAQEGLFDEVLDLPTALLTAHPQVFIEFATAAAPEEPLAEERMQFTLPGEPAGARQREGERVTDVAVCFSCGGDFPFLAGTVATRSGGKNLERGRHCAGQLRARRDPQPRICYGFNPL